MCAEYLTELFRFRILFLLLVVCSFGLFTFLILLLSGENDEESKDDRLGVLVLTSIQTFIYFLVGSSYLGITNMDY